MQCGCYLKIGYTGRPIEQRLRDIRAGSPYDVVLLGTMSGTRTEEKALLASFRGSHHRAEWFHYDPSILSAFGLDNPEVPL